MQEKTLRRTTVAARLSQLRPDRPDMAPRGSLALVADDTKRVADAPATMTISLALLSDDPLLCEGVSALLRGQPDVRVLAACADPLPAMQTRGFASSVLLLDAALPDLRILGAAAQVRRASASIRMIAIGVRVGQPGLVRFVQAGVSGFILKEAPFTSFLAAIRQVAGGGIVMPAELANTLFSQIARPEAGRQAGPERIAARLTLRERQVVGLIRQGLSNKEIASRLNLAVHTAKTHVHNVLEKLSLRSRLEVAVCTGARDEAAIC